MKFLTLHTGVNPHIMLAYIPKKKYMTFWGQGKKLLKQQEFMYFLQLIVSNYTYNKLLIIKQCCGDHT